MESKNGKQLLCVTERGFFYQRICRGTTRRNGLQSGGYIQIEIPECEVNFQDIDISAHPEEHPGEPDKFKLEWDKFNLWPLVMKNPESVERAYSMASYPAEGREIMLNVRIATPPWDRAKMDGWMLTQGLPLPISSLKKLEIK